MVARDVSEDLREREEAMATWRWWEEHYGELLSRYPEQFVLIDKNRKVIGAYPSLTDVCSAMDEKGLRFVKDADTEFITAQDRWHL